MDGAMSTPGRPKCEYSLSEGRREAPRVHK